MPKSHIHWKSQKNQTWKFRNDGGVRKKLVPGGGDLKEL